MPGLCDRWTDDLPPLHPTDQVADTRILARVLGETPGSASAHLLAACEAGGYDVQEKIRREFPALVAAFEAWRRHAAPHAWQVPTVAQVRAALNATSQPHEAD
ncbi:hypothetical protein [Salinispora vitiensis]|uniref:hypothetical protein n=1 Tax=Salinispora vitiensis TaxID=999544 RepID=UPI0013A545B1|nr:hypothetical protein [Salinispora vitiensis]